jgi:hypothetical protein
MKVDLGENKALSMLTYKQTKDGQHLGAVVYIPTEVRDGKTYYKALGVEAPITTEQRNAIITMLGGIVP